jgi:hypothetical protein
MKLSLCIIFGNSAEYLPRFLDQFRVLTPHIVAVRAIGNQQPDDSWQICESFGCKMGEYKNAKHPDWPHVDDFAAARNLAFSLADEDSDFLMWADTDDIILPASADAIQKSLATLKPDETMVQLPYRILHMDLVLWRERIVRPGLFEWKYPVHECLNPITEPTEENKLKIVRVVAEIIHGPKRSKTGGNERNLRILESVEGDHISLTYHLFQEYIAKGDVTKALPIAERLNKHPDCGRDERFEMFLMLGSATAENVEQSRQFFELAMHAAPERAEAPVELANWHLNCGDRQHALAYARMAEALPLPSDCWNARRWAYGWNRDDILRQAQRALGLPVKHQPGCRISVIHPTCRPIDAIARRRQWLLRAAKPELVEYIFGVNEGDKEVCGQLMRFDCAVSKAVTGGHSSAVANYNAAFEKASCEIIVAAQDDIEPPDGWDYQILKAMEKHLDKPAVLHVHDGFRDDQIMVVMVVNKAWKNRQKYLLSPEYDGWFSDTEYSIRAYQAGEVVDGRHIKFIHWHPSFTGAESDEAYMRQQNPEAYARNKAIFERRNPNLTPAS